MPGKRERIYHGKNENRCWSTHKKGRAAAAKKEVNGIFLIFCLLAFLTSGSKGFHARNLKLREKERQEEEKLIDSIKREREIDITI